jgi:hypothetical protein
MPQITTIINQSKKDKARKANEGKTHRGAERIVDAKGNVLPDFKPETIDDSLEDTWRENHKNSVEFKTAENGRLGSLFEHEAYGHKLTITYNIEHPFYQVFFGNTENNDLIDAVDCLVYSMAAGLTKINLGQNEQKLADLFSDTMSSTLRSLLN